MPQRPRCAIVYSPARTGVVDWVPVIRMRGIAGVMKTDCRDAAGRERLDAATPASDAPEQAPVTAASPAAADLAAWEFRLAADGRRMLVQIAPPARGHVPS
jgi:hypothetical protein